MGTGTGALVASGGDADVFEHRPGLVLRRYRAGGDTAREAEVIRRVAAHGYPVPHVHEAEGRDLVLERLTGPTALRALLDGQVGADAVGVLLAGLHRRLHALPPRTPSPPRSSVAGRIPRSRGASRPSSTVRRNSSARPSDPCRVRRLLGRPARTRRIAG